MPLKIVQVLKVAAGGGGDNIIIAAWKPNGRLTLVEAGNWTGEDRISVYLCEDRTAANAVGLIPQSDTTTTSSTNADTVVWSDGKGILFEPPTVLVADFIGADASDIIGLKIGVE